MATRVAFVVQGEGRGHFSQALAMQQLLSGKEWEICVVLVGINSQRQLPSYFHDAFGANILTYQSPNFDTDPNGQGILVAKSILKSLIRIPSYLRSAKSIVKTLKQSRAEVVINFYEPLFGLSQFFWKLSIPKVSIAHQFMIFHSSFELPPKPISDKIGLKLLTRIAQNGSDLILALSFYHQNSYGKKLKVVPPLLRKEIRKNYPPARSEDFYLIYILNKGYAEDIENWQRKNPQTVIHCFWDNYDKPEHYSPTENLHFHHLSGPRFLEKMAHCRALITTAGFESVCEALYLDKPVAMIPVYGHYEQRVNSYDALKTRLAFRFDAFDMELIMKKLRNPEMLKRESTRIKKWFDQSDQTILYHLNNLVNKVSK